MTERQHAEVSAFQAWQREYGQVAWTVRPVVDLDLYVEIMVGVGLVIVGIAMILHGWRMPA